MDLLVGQSFEHETDHAEVDPGLARGGQEFVVSAHAAIASDPGEGAFHDPRSWQELKAPKPERALLVCWQPLSPSPRPLDNLQPPAQRLPCPGLQRAHIRAIGPDQLQSGQRVGDSEQQPWSAGAVLEIRRVNVRLDDQAEGIDEQMAFAPGVGKRPACWRTRSLKIVWICCQTPTRHQRRKYAYTVDQGPNDRGSKRH
jgi:hypothetical protein